LGLDGGHRNDHGRTTIDLYRGSHFGQPAERFGGLGASSDRILALDD